MPRGARSRHTAALAAAVGVSLLLGAHDFLLLLRLLPPENIYLLPYGGLVMFGVVMHAMASGYDHALRRAQVLSDERQRLVREMHDGLGSTLASSLVAAQRGQLPPEAVTAVLRESVDELRLTLDTLDPAGHEPLLQLANLRYRIGLRLEAAGVHLDWQLHDWPARPALSSAAALQLVRVLQEALANVAKHARASRVCVRSESSAAGVALVVSDDGCGFDVAAASAAAHAASGGRGLANLRRRAESLGAKLTIDSSSAGTTLRITIPWLEHDGASAGPADGG